MSKAIVICEGQRDRVFIYEVMINKIGFDLTQVKAYASQLPLVNDIRRRKQPDVAIVEGNGFHGCIRVAVHLSRDLWYLNEPQSIGVVTDSDCGPTYPKMLAYLIEYLNTPCKKHNVNPQLARNDSEMTLTISYGDDPCMFMWAVEVPNSLETQTTISLKRKYNKLRQCDTEEETIKAACKMLRSCEDRLFSKSVKLFEHERWFKTFCKKLDERITPH